MSHYAKAAWYIAAGVVLAVTTWAGYAYHVPLPPIAAQVAQAKSVSVSPTDTTSRTERHAVSFADRPSVNDMDFRSSRVTELPEDGSEPYTVIVGQGELQITAALTRLASHPPTRSLLESTRIHAYTPTDPLYVHRWALMGDAGPLPQVWLIDQGRILYKSSGTVRPREIAQCTPQLCRPTFDESRSPRRIIPDIKPQVNVGIPAGVRVGLYVVGGLLALLLLVVCSVCAIGVCVMVLKRAVR